MAIDKFAHGGNIHSYLKKTGTMPVLDFSANINPVGLSQLAKKAIRENLENIVHYPESYSESLKKAIAAFYQVKKEKIAVGNGASELIYLICQLLRPGKVFLAVPCFSEYERAALASGALIEYFYLPKEKNFAVSYEKIFAQVSENSLLFLGNPNNPTGKLLEKTGFEKFLANLAEKKCTLIVDESFIDFLQEAENFSLRSYVNNFPNLFIIHSLTKFFAIPGLRLGFGLFPELVAEKLKLSTDCWNVNALAQAAGEAALQDKDYIKQSKLFLQKEKERFSQCLSEFKDLEVYPSTVNFILLKLKKVGLNSADFCQKMLECGVLVRDCANYPGLDDSYIRIAVRTKEENEQFLNFLRKLEGESNGN